MSPRPLSPCASLEHLKNQAKALLKAHQAGDPQAINRLKAHLPRLKNLSEVDVARSKLALHDAQRVIAHEYDFGNWAKLKHQIEPPTKLIQLRQAIDEGDLQVIRQLVQDEPDLVNQALPKITQHHNALQPLSYACDRSQVAAARVLLEAGADASEQHNSPLAYATFRRQAVEFWELLLNHGTDLYDVGKDVQLPLLTRTMFAWDPAKVKWLLEHGADPNYINPNQAFNGTALDLLLLYIWDSQEMRQQAKFLIDAGGKTVFENHPFYDMRLGNMEAFEQTLRASPDLINQHVPYTFKDTFAIDGLNAADEKTLLHLAVQTAHVQGTKLLLALGADVEIKTKPSTTEKTLNRAFTGDSRAGLTPIFLLLAHYDDRINPTFELLLQHGVNLTDTAVFSAPLCEKDQTVRLNPMDVALRMYRPRTQQTIDWLVSYGAKPSDLFGAVMLGMVDEVKRHLVDGADPNMKIDMVTRGESQSILSIAAGQGHNQVCKLLLEAGAHNTIDIFDAASGGLMSILAQLLEQNPLLANQHDEHEASTPLHLAAINNQAEAIVLLLQYGADINAHDALLDTPLHHAIAHGCMEAFDCLLKASPDIHAKNYSQATPIIHAAWADHATVAMVEQLIQHGANIHDINNCGSVLDIAQRWNHEEIAQLLLRHGAQPA